MTDPEKIESLRVFLEETGIPGLALTKGQAIKPELFNAIGPSIVSGRSIFIYGPPGNGKTSIARSIGDFMNRYSACSDSLNYEIVMTVLEA